MRNEHVPGEGRGEGGLDLAAASRSPCATCSTSPCCTHLPLQTFSVEDMRGVDHARYLLNFQRIRLGLSADGSWQVYYHHPCRYLDRATRACTVHGEPRQPRICVHYNPYACWYKEAMGASVTDHFLLLDRRRFEYVLERLEFDELLRLVGVPDWPSMIEAMAEMPLDPDFDDDIEDDEAYEQWLTFAAYGGDLEPPRGGLSYASLRDPCTGCSAWCCRFLVFPQPVAEHASALDYLQFALGFPGVELGLSDQGWALVLRTRCRHLDEGRCSIYGQPERPQICTYYDGVGCTYRRDFGRPRPDDFFRVRLEHFDWLLETFSFDAEGNIDGIPTTESARRYVEWRWQAAVHAALADTGDSAEGGGADDGVTARASAPGADGLVRIGEPGDGG